MSEDDLLAKLSPEQLDELTLRLEARRIDKAMERSFVSAPGIEATWQRELRLRHEEKAAARLAACQFNEGLYRQAKERWETDQRSAEAAARIADLRREAEHLRRQAQPYEQALAPIRSELREKEQLIAELSKRTTWDGVLPADLLELVREVR